MFRKDKIWKLDDQTMRGLIPWSRQGLLDVLGGRLGKETGQVICQLVDRHGRKRGEAHVIRLMAAGHFLEQNREHLIRSKLLEDRPGGDFMIPGLAEALATLPFTKEFPSGVGEEAHWDFDPATVFRTAHTFNRKIEH